MSPIYLTLASVSVAKHSVRVVTATIVLIDPIQALRPDTTRVAMTLINVDVTGQTSELWGQKGCHVQYNDTTGNDVISR